MTAHAHARTQAHDAKDTYIPRSTKQRRHATLVRIAVMLATY